MDIPHLSPFLMTVCTICLAALLAAGGMCMYRIIVGPRAGDRAVAFDVLAMSFMGIICVLCITWNSSLYFDAVWILTLVGFLGSAAIAKYLERGRVF
jgi:multisubunit Na+/H+ antiporter MnhF subunit